MKRLVAACAALLLLAGCAGNPEPVSVQIERVPVEVLRPCAATIAPRPTARPLPTDLEALAATLGAWLKEYTAPGGWADKAEGALAECTTP
jgi:hypothetical protein